MKKTVYEEPVCRVITCNLRRSIAVSSPTEGQLETITEDSGEIEFN